MGFYTKKPTVYEAYHFQNDTSNLPDWLTITGTSGAWKMVTTSYGDLPIPDDCYIVKAENGNHEVYDAASFADKYQPVA